MKYVVIVFNGKRAERPNVYGTFISEAAAWRWAKFEWQKTGHDYFVAPITKSE